MLAVQLDLMAVFILSQLNVSDEADRLLFVDVCVSVQCPTTVARSPIIPRNDRPSATGPHS